MIDKNLIQRINELSQIAKERELTQKEQDERNQLRQEYLKQFKEGFRQRLDNLKIIDENGNEINRKINKKGDA